MGYGCNTVRGKSVSIYEVPSVCHKIEVDRTEECARGKLNYCIMYRYLERVKVMLIGTDCIYFIMHGEFKIN